VGANLSAQTGIKMPTNTWVKPVKKRQPERSQKLVVMVIPTSARALGTRVMIKIHLVDMWLNRSVPIIDPIPLISLKVVLTCSQAPKHYTT